ncbi:MAG: long-chain fatty acid--CoA ligase [Bacteroidetes bacterium]|nr:MAG: long-chain fatty acid--CoA ligase [Bacteroidota bacterium]
MEITRIFDFLDYQQQNYPSDKAMAKKVDGQWKYYSTQDLIDQSMKMASGLLDLGVKQGDKVAITSYKNRPEWTIADIATQIIGAINVPLYPTISPGEFEYILNDAEVSYAFVGADDLYDKMATAKANVPSLKEIYTFDKQEGRPFWEDMWSEGHFEQIEQIKQNIKPEDVATIIYTSGTTGNPKGVVLKHSSIVFVVIESCIILPKHSQGMDTLSFLPLCHIFERAVSFAYLYKGMNCHFTGTDNLGGETGDLRTVAPYFFTTVPRLLEKVYEAIYNKGLGLSGIKKFLFFWALRMTDDYEYDKTYSGWASVKRKIADKLIFSKWREALGGNVQGIVTGAAPCPPNILKVFSAAGIPVREGYGLTETAPTISVNYFEPGAAMIGTVGPIVKGVEVLIDDSDGNYREGEGEILAKGPNVMVGYYKKPDENMRVFKEIDGETWFCTGDVGKLVKNKAGRDFLKITDRKKELLKTSGGKYVAPAPIEGRFRESFLVEQIMVVGNNKKFVSALIVPAVEALKSWCEDHEVEWTSVEEAIKHPKVVQRYQWICEKYNPEFSKIEQIKKFTLVPDQWEAVKTDGSDSELTPTMKLKRRVILDKFAKQIEELYSD